MFHINACSLRKNFADLEYLLKTANMNFDIIAISKTRINKNINRYLTLTLITMPLNSPLLDPQQEEL